MNIKHKLSNSSRHGFKRHGFKRHGLNRNGLSVIEVLTSIVVALIGVFGVLAMIPFSVKQTQSGLDQDAATSMARNALADFEASGFKVVSDDGSGGRLNWLDNTGTNNVITTISPATDLLCIDPLGVRESGVSSFPFNSPSPITMQTVTLARPGVDPATGAPIAFTLADARRMFRLTDDLVFEEADNPNDEDSALLGPVQIFNEVDVAGALQSLNRQSNGTISWCAIAEPNIVDPDTSEIESFKFYILVFKDRVTDVTAPESAMLAAPVISPVTFGQSAAVTIAEELTDDVRRNDWVMLINREMPDPSLPNEPIARRTNISFARIANQFSTETGSSLTLDGPDFQFTNSGLAPDGSGTPSPEATFIVHLRDVVAVFPRTIKLESNSGWTVSAD